MTTEGEHVGEHGVTVVAAPLPGCPVCDEAATPQPTDEGRLAEAVEFGFERGEAHAMVDATDEARRNYGLGTDRNIDWLPVDSDVAAAITDEGSLAGRAWKAGWNAAVALFGQPTDEARPALPMDPDPDAVEVAPGTMLHHGLYLRGKPTDEARLLREALRLARLVAQWHDSIGSGPPEVLNDEGLP